MTHWFRITAPSSPSSIGSSSRSGSLDSLDEGDLLIQEPRCTAYEIGCYLAPRISQPCYCSLVSFDPRSGCTLATFTLVVLDYPNKDTMSTSAHTAMGRSKFQFLNRTNRCSDLSHNPRRNTG